MCVRATGYNSLHMAPSRKLGEKRGGRPDALSLARRRELAELWRPIMGHESSVARSHFEARRAVYIAIAQAILGVQRLRDLGSRQAGNLDEAIRNLESAKRLLQVASPSDDSMIVCFAAALADRHAQWSDVERSILGKLADDGLPGADDPHVLAAADVMRSAKTFKNRKSARRKTVPRAR